MICQDCKRIRPEVRRLALAMEAKLRKNDEKGGWADMDQWQMYHRMIDECRELTNALVGMNPKFILDECADVANFAMMIADKYGRARRK
jgi:hypothetical protein